MAAHQDTNLFSDPCPSPPESPISASRPETPPSPASIAAFKAGLHPLRPSTRGAKFYLERFYGIDLYNNLDHNFNYEGKDACCGDLADFDFGFEERPDSTQSDWDSDSSSDSDEPIVDSPPTPPPKDPTKKPSSISIPKLLINGLSMDGMPATCDFNPATETDSPAWPPSAYFKDVARPPPLFSPTATSAAKEADLFSSARPHISRGFPFFPQPPPLRDIHPAFRNATQPTPTPTSSNRLPIPTPREVALDKELTVAFPEPQWSLQSKPNKLQKRRDISQSSDDDAFPPPEKLCSMLKTSNPVDALIKFNRLVLAKPDDVVSISPVSCPSPSQRRLTRKITPRIDPGVFDEIFGKDALGRSQIEQILTQEMVVERMRKSTAMRRGSCVRVGEVAGWGWGRRRPVWR